MNSSRLPGKALLEIGSCMLIERVINRVNLVPNHGRIVVAISDKISDDPLYCHLKKLDCDIFRGSLNNVLDRAIKCADFYGFTSFLRVCGDRPLFPYHFAGDAIDFFKNGDFDLVSGNFDKSLPPGMMTEVISVSALKKIASLPISSFQKEHITNYFYKNLSSFNVKDIYLNIPSVYKNISLAVDTEADLQRIRYVFDNQNFLSNILSVNEIFQLSKC
jgi:spore coat polysaccharide biosynthesis protein SpsF